MSGPVTDSSAYVGRYADRDNTPWPWWAMLVLLPLAFAWGLVPRRRRRR